MTVLLKAGNTIPRHRCTATSHDGTAQTGRPATVSRLLNHCHAVRHHGIRLILRAKMLVRWLVARICHRANSVEITSGHLMEFTEKCYYPSCKCFRIRSRRLSVDEDFVEE